MRKRGNYESETGGRLVKGDHTFDCRDGTGVLRAGGAVSVSYTHLDLAILENVGNLVCPAEFDTGAVKNAMILSVPEGDDKPLKYPLMFSICDVLLINKIDVLPYFDFDIEACKERVKKLNPNIQIIPISSRTGEGMDAWYDWLRTEVKQWNN